MLAFWREGTFDQIKTPVFQFNDKIDCLSLDNSFVIFNQRNFHYIFNYFDEAQKAAKNTIQDLISRIPISGADQFEVDCAGNSVIALKLRAISRSPSFGSLTFDQIEKVVAKLNLPVEFITDDQVKKILYKKEQKWTILKLLDDAYLQSIATEAIYQAGSKRPFSQ